MYTIAAKHAIYSVADLIYYDLVLISVYLKERKKHYDKILG